MTESAPEVRSPVQTVRPFLEGETEMTFEPAERTDAVPARASVLPAATAAVSAVRARVCRGRNGTWWWGSVFTASAPAPV
ncbi:hypothetical protein [Streptomyces sp. H72]